MASTLIPPEGAAAFLARHGWAGARVEALAADASFRRYFRVHGDAGSAVLMDAPPQLEDAGPFVAIAAHLATLGLSAPGVLAAEPEHGLVLLEDLGDARLNPLLARGGGDEAALYGAAVDVLVALAGHAPPEGLAPYALGELRREVLLFVDWYLPAVGLAAAAGPFLEAWNGVLAYAFSPHPVLVLRDYHADNLMVLDRPGVRRLGLLDFQDALAGHRAYDLVSLLQDARRDLALGIEAAMIERYVAAAPGVRDPARFAASYAVLGAQRHTKILGIFARLARRDGKPAYLAHLPRVWRKLEMACAHPVMAPVRDWFEANVPAGARAGAL